MPKPRVISLEPISKRAKAKVKVRRASQERGNGPILPQPVSRTNTDSSTTSGRRTSDLDPPLSPAPSDITSASATSNSTQSFQLVNSPPSISGSSHVDSENRSSLTSLSSQTITTTAELLKQGALPGDIIPIKVSVTHTKPNARGLVIVTLYRQGRIDMHPAIPLVPKGKGKKAQYEDIYPRSKTGLGGLYLSNGSPSSAYRKDLCQSTAMMVVNPQTLTAEIKASVRLPENAFPTMTNVPGGMIVFRYYVEIVIDLCGKLGEARFLPRLTAPQPSFHDTTDHSNQITSNWANNILDTAQLRRTKSVIDVTFPLIVGSKDSTRDARRWATDRQQCPQNLGVQQNTNVRPSSRDLDYEDQGDGDADYSEHFVDPNLDTIYVPPPSLLIPPPEPEEDEEEVDEKTRLRRQEALLLPSQPPEDDPSSSVADVSTPSAPFITEESELYHLHGSDDCGVGPSTPYVAPSAFSTRSVDTIIAQGEPSHDPPAFGGDTSHSNEDDKRDLERQRLLALASAPPDANTGGDQQMSSTLAVDFTPTAPVLDAEDEYIVQTLNHVNLGGEHLPRYQR